MNLYKELGLAIQNNINDEWEKVTVNIESSLHKMCSFQTECFLFSGKTKQIEFSFPVLNDLMDSVLELQESMYPNHKWNKAVYTLDKAGHFDMSFEWDQALQDEWDKN